MTCSSAWMTGSACWRAAGRGRPRRLETMRLYGAERLLAAGEDREMRQRHAAWYAGLISPGERSWFGTPRQVEFLDALDVEWANVEAALEFCAGSPDSAGPGVATG